MPGSQEYASSANGNQMRLGAEKNRAVRNSRRHQTIFAQRILGQYDELWSGLHHMHLTLFAGEIQLAISRDRRCRVRSSTRQALRVYLLACLRLVARHDASVRARIEMSAIHNRRLH